MLHCQLQSICLQFSNAILTYLPIFVYSVYRLGNLLVLIGPLLDAFGNAATSRNDNSSRFGKCVSTIFDFRGYMVGAKVLHFMLERVRR